MSDGDVKGLDNDPSRPPIPGCNVNYVKWKTRRVIESIWFRVFTFILILIDVSIVIVEIVQDDDGEHNMAFLIIDLIITIYFVVEIGVRIWVLGQQVSFQLSLSIRLFFFGGGDPNGEPLNKKYHPRIKSRLHKILAYCRPSSQSGTT